jgi:hypothetical protein
LKESIQRKNQKASFSRDIPTRTPLQRKWKTSFRETNKTTPQSRRRRRRRKPRRKEEKTRKKLDKPGR